MKNKMTDEERALKNAVRADKASVIALVISIIMFILVILANLDKILPIPH